MNLTIAILTILSFAYIIFQKELQSYIETVSTKSKIAIIVILIFVVLSAVFNGFPLLE